MSGLEHLSGAALRREQERTLAAPRMRDRLLARVLFRGMDLVYGRPWTLSKFKVLELIARVPYQAWEQAAYVAMTHTSRAPDFARRIFDRVRESRHQQDNEQWHEYMEFVRECPELEREPFESVVTADYGRFESLADLFRQIGYDERVHKEESLAWMAQPRFA